MEKQTKRSRSRINLQGEKMTAPQLTYDQFKYFLDLVKTPINEEGFREWVNCISDMTVAELSALTYYLCTGLDGVRTHQPELYDTIIVSIKKGFEDVEKWKNR